MYWNFNTLGPKFEYVRTKLDYLNNTFWPNQLTKLIAISMHLIWIYCWSIGIVLINVRIIEICNIEDHNLLKFQQHVHFTLLQLPKPGDFVAFVHTEWRTWPLIGEVQTVSEGRFTCGGGKEAIQQPSKRRGGRQTMPWTEDIPIKDIVLQFFGNRGQTATNTSIRELKLA